MISKNRDFKSCLSARSMPPPSTNQYERKTRCLWRRFQPNKMDVSKLSNQRLYSFDQKQDRQLGITRKGVVVADKTLMKTQNPFTQPPPYFFIYRVFILKQDLLIFLIFLIQNNNPFKKSLKMHNSKNICLVLFR